MTRRSETRNARLADPLGLMREKDVYIYSLSAADGVVRYVGAATVPKGRLYSHIYNSTVREHTEPAALWIRSVVAAGQTITMTILERVPREALNYHSREAHWIEVFGGVNALLNATSDGRGGPWRGTKRPGIGGRAKGSRFTPEQREKVRKGVQRYWDNKKATG